MVLELNKHINIIFLYCKMKKLLFIINLAMNNKIYEKNNFSNFSNTNYSFWK